MFRVWILTVIFGFLGLFGGNLSAQASVRFMSADNTAEPIVAVAPAEIKINAEVKVEPEADANTEIKPETKENKDEYDDVYTPEEYVSAVEGIRFKNPYMEYGESHNISEVIKDALTFKVQNITAQDAKNPDALNFVYIMRGERALAEMLDNGENCMAYIDDAINERVISNGDINTEDLQYKYVCESRVSTVSKNPVEVCEGEDMAEVLQEYKECIVSLDIEDSEMVEKMADCKKPIEAYKEQHCQVETNVETSVECNGKRYFTVRYSDNEGIMYIPLERIGNQYRVSPDMVGLEYRQAVEKLQDMYGPATQSIRRKHYADMKHCSNLASFADFQETGRIDRYYSDTYYWNDKNWIVRCQVVFAPDVVRPVYNSPVKYVSTIYINKHALNDNTRKTGEN